MVVPSDPPQQGVSGTGSDIEDDEPVDYVSSAPDFSCFMHTPCYCEENVYFLCKKMMQMGLSDPRGIDLFVVFISNHNRQVPLWKQKASKEDDGLVLWDYHVICIQSKSNKNRQRCRVSEGTCDDFVWDLDSTLPFPSPLNQYVIETIKPTLLLHTNFRRLFRIIHAPHFIKYFASDRSHMRDSNGNWLSPPPPYEPIVSEDGILNNLTDYIEMHTQNMKTDFEDLVFDVFSNNVGTVISETQLEGLFSSIQDRK